MVKCTEFVGASCCQHHHVSLSNVFRELKLLGLEFSEVGHRRSFYILLSSYSVMAYLNV